MRIGEYKVVDASSPDDLTDYVQSHIRNGWQPLDGAFLSRVSEYAYRYCQTLVRYVEGRQYYYPPK